MVQEIVINNCYGGFSLTDEFVAWLREQGHKDAEKETIAGEYFSDGSGPKDEFVGVHPDYISRTDELLLKAVKGKTDFDGSVGGRCAELKVVEVPDGVDWEIDEYDGFESVEETHRSWG